MRLYKDADGVYRSKSKFTNEETPMTRQPINVRFWFLYSLLLALLMLWAINSYAQAANVAVISYQAATGRTDGTTMSGAVSYEVWQGLKGATKTKVGTITATSTSITTGLTGGNEYCWYVITREAGNSNPSAPSNEACKAFAVAGPNTVTITVT